ncbi:MAG: AbrB/MazE/SpoVT family DNA-binding domain-containing protein [Thermoleophilia bacterium]
MTRVRITSGGQVSIPAELRRRWGASELEIDDHGDHLVLRPADADPIAAARGALAGVAATDALRARARADGPARRR